MLRVVLAKDKFSITNYEVDQKTIRISGKVHFIYLCTQTALQRNDNYINVYCVCVKCYCDLNGIQIDQRVLIKKQAIRDIVEIRKTAICIDMFMCSIENALSYTSGSTTC